MQDYNALELVCWTLGIFIAYQVVLAVYRVCYNLYFHRLAKYPGPKSFAASWIPHASYKIRDPMPFIVRDLHDRYGPVVRTGPDELSFISGQAWRDIYSQQPGLPQNPRDPYSYSDASTDEFMRHNILMANGQDHTRQRSHLAHAFSTRALHEQLPLISSHIDRFIDRLRARASEGPQDMTTWFIWVTFDIIGDLAVGQSFGCLETESHHPWIRSVFQGAEVGTVMVNLRRFGINPGKMIPKFLLKPRLEMFIFCRDRMNRRLALGEPTERRDFMLRGSKKGGPAMTKEELYANATLLTGVTFLLLTQRPDWPAKLTHAVRTTFKDDSIDEMKFQTVTSKLPLLVATMTEALRIYPPVPSAHPRLIEMPNRSVDGKVIPLSTAVAMYQWAANHSVQNWYKPDHFLPERWLDVQEEHQDPELTKGIARDRKDSMSPFSLRAWNRLGRNLAEMEMRLVFARLL